MRSFWWLHITLLSSGIVISRFGEVPRRILRHLRPAQADGVHVASSMTHLLRIVGAMNYCNCGSDVTRRC
jgi:hypothetical protein